MTQSIKCFASMLTLIFISSIGTQATADEYHHIDRLALRLQRDTKRLIRESTHYRHSSEFRHLVADAKSLYRLASHIHEVTHFEGNLRHLQHDVDTLDREFHHLEAIFDRIEHDASYNVGHVHGNTAHVKRLLNSIENSIHHMAEDLATIGRRTRVGRPIHGGPIHVQPNRRPVYGHGYRVSRMPYGNRRSLTIGGGSSQFQIRF